MLRRQAEQPEDLHGFGLENRPQQRHDIAGTRESLAAINRRKIRPAAISNLQFARIARSPCSGLSRRSGGSGAEGTVFSVELRWERARRRYVPERSVLRIVDVGLQ